MTGKKGKVQCINDEILEKMSLKNRNKFVNNNLMSVLKPEHFNFLRKTQRFYERFETKNNITHDEDFYDWIPIMGKEGLVSRVTRFEDIGLNFDPYGITIEFLRILATDFFDPQMAIFA
ncbi:MAG: hypothetical protein ACFFBP_21230 [Promethearchaeota archaeon]